ncbi:MAG TPA: metallophosphoesterase [Gaiella sp.]
MSTAALVASVLVLGMLAYGWFEAGWLRTTVLELPLAGLPAALDGLRITHLSDLHLGAPLSRGNRAGARAAKWAAGRKPDLICITGDLVSHPRGEPRLREILALLDDPVVVLGNHDVAVTRDPFSRAAELRDLEATSLLGDGQETRVLRNEPVSIVGVSPETFRTGAPTPHELIAPGATLRLLLCHYPDIARRIPPGSFDLILTGHLHAGQICLPLVGRRVALAHPRATLIAGRYDTPAGTMHVSPGTGTTFVPFRFFARPEVTELVLRRSD